MPRAKEAMPERVVRNATVKDVSILATIRSDATAYKLGRGDLAWGNSGWTEEVTQRAVDQGDLYVVEQDGIAVAMLSLFWQDDEYWGPQEPNAGYIHTLSVRAGFHGLGLGTYAIDWCEDLVRANSRDRLRLDCDPRNTKLCGYYESLGFVRVGTKPFPSGYIASLYERPVR